MQGTRTVAISIGTARTGRVATKTGVLTMKTATTLLLAARILLSLGVGTATAQGLTPGSGEGVYFSGLHQTAPGLLSFRSGRVE
jgi:hypothetical protein